MILLNVFQGMDFYNGLFFLLQALARVVDFWSFFGQGFCCGCDVGKVVLAPQ